MASRWGAVVCVCVSFGNGLVLLPKVAARFTAIPKVKKEGKGPPPSACFLSLSPVCVPVPKTKADMAQAPHRVSWCTTLRDDDDAYSVVDAMSDAEQDADADPVLTQFEAWLQSRQMMALPPQQQDPRTWQVHAEPPAPAFCVSSCGMRRWRGDALAHDVHLLTRALPERKKELQTLAHKTRGDLHALLKAWTEGGDPVARQWWEAECAAERLCAMMPSPLRGGAHWDGSHCLSKPPVPV